MNEVIETTQEATEEINIFVRYIQDNIPNMISFGVRVILALIFFFIGKYVIKLIRKAARTMLERSSVDKGVEQFVDSLLKFGLYAILVFSIAAKLGVNTTSVAAIFASAGLALGLALQGSLSNFAGGVLILLMKPFVVGDYIIEDNHKNEGTVKEIRLFYTTLVTVDNRSVIIPNSMLTSNSLTNVTQMEERCLDLKVMISYESDLKHAKHILRDLVNAEGRIHSDKDKKVFVHDLADDGVILGIRAWVDTDKYWPVRWELLENIKFAFDQEGIVIPYRQLEVQMKK